MWEWAHPPGYNLDLEKYSGLPKETKEINAGKKVKRYGGLLNPFLSDSIPTCSSAFQLQTVGIQWANCWRRGV